MVQEDIDKAIGQVPHPLFGKSLKSGRGQPVYQRPDYMQAAAHISADDSKAQSISWGPEGSLSDFMLSILSET